MKKLLILLLVLTSCSTSHLLDSYEITENDDGSLLVDFDGVKVAGKYLDKDDEIEGELTKNATADSPTPAEVKPSENNEGMQAWEALMYE